MTPEMNTLYWLIFVFKEWKTRTVSGQFVSLCNITEQLRVVIVSSHTSVLSFTLSGYYM